jgi:hypothetical protein
MDERRERRKKKKEEGRPGAWRLLGKALWSFAVTASVAAFVLFALLACKSAGHR